MTMKSSRLENDKKKKKRKENIIKDSRLEKEKYCITIKDIGNLFRMEKENKAIKDILLEILGTFLSMKKEKAIAISKSR